MICGDPHFRKPIYIFIWIYKQSFTGSLVAFPCHFPAPPSSPPENLAEHAKQKLWSPLKEEFTTKMKDRTSNNVGKPMPCLPPMTGNCLYYTTYTNGDDWGMVYGIALPTSVGIYLENEESNHEKG